MYTHTPLSDTTRTYSQSYSHERGLLCTFITPDINLCILNWVILTFSYLGSIMSGLPLPVIRIISSSLFLGAHIQELHILTTQTNLTMLPSYFVSANQYRHLFVMTSRHRITRGEGELDWMGNMSRENPMHPVTIRTHGLPFLV